MGKGLINCNLAAGYLLCFSSEGSVSTWRIEIC